MILRKVVMLILVVFGMRAIMPVAWGASIQEIAQSLLTSTVILEMEKRGEGANGVGFIIGDNKIATNYHIIEGMSVGTVRLIGTKKKYEITSVFNQNIGYDLAIVSVASDDNKIAPAMAVGDSDLVEAGDKVYALANPQKVIGSFEEGSIERIVQGNTWRISGRIFKGKTFVVTLPVKSGASGGAVLNDEGEIIGVVVAKFRDREGGLVIPINYAKALLNQDQGVSNVVVVEIPDPDLKASIRKGLDKKVGDPITTQDMLGISEISLRYNKIKNISGLEYAKNLTSLNLYSNDISDLSPLSGLVNLEYLNLASNEISDLSPLSGLTSLEQLNLAVNKIVDLSPLSKLTGLKELNLRASQWSSNPRFDDITALSTLTNLEILNIGKNRVWDLSPLSNMGKLKELYVHSNLIFDIEPLLMLQTLETVDLRNNPLNENSINSILPKLVEKGVKSHLSYLYFSGSQTVAKGEMITWDLNIKNAQNLSTINLHIKADTQDYSIVEILEGDFMKQDDALTFFIEGTPDENNVDDISVVRLNKGGANGDGTVIQIKIRGDNIGAKQIYFDAELIDIAGEEMFHGEQRGIYLKVVASTDVNGDGVVDTKDLQYVIERIGSDDHSANLNGDRYINLKDFAMVAAALNNSPIASVDTGQNLEPYLAPPALPDSKASLETIESWIDMMETANDGTTYYLDGIRNLKALAMLYGIRRPDKTALLKNYPNPFNPETWIPYRLAEDAFVTLTIYDGVGRVVRTLDVGHRIAGVYESQSKAIHWDGRNEAEEQVASDLYFYHLSAGDFSATRKMVILK